MAFMITRGGSDAKAVINRVDRNKVSKYTMLGCANGITESKRSRAQWRNAYTWMKSCKRGRSKRSKYSVETTSSRIATNSDTWAACSQPMEEMT